MSKSLAKEIIDKFLSDNKLKLVTIYSEAHLRTLITGKPAYIRVFWIDNEKQNMDFELVDDPGPGTIEIPVDTR